MPRFLIDRAELKEGVVALSAKESHHALRVMRVKIGDAVELIDGEGGVWHLANSGAISWTELARRVVGELGLDRDLVEEAAPEELGRLAARPSYSALGTERGSLMPSLEESLDRIFRDRASSLAGIS